MPFGDAQICMYRLGSSPPPPFPQLCSHHISQDTNRSSKSNYAPTNVKPHKDREFQPTFLMYCKKYFDGQTITKRYLQFVREYITTYTHTYAYKKNGQKVH